jgi:hypothetical protein
MVTLCYCIANLYQPEHTVECVKESCSINPECKGCYWCEKVKAPRVLTALEQAQLKAHMKHKAPVLNSTSLSEPAVEKREDTEDPPDKDDDLESEDSDCSDEDGDVPVPLNKDARPNPQCFECNRQLGERCGGVSTLHPIIPSLQPLTHLSVSTKRNSAGGTSASAPKPAPAKAAAADSKAQSGPNAARRTAFRNSRRSAQTLR